MSNPQYTVLWALSHIVELELSFGFCASPWRHLWSASVFVRSAYTGFMAWITAPWVYKCVLFKTLSCYRHQVSGVFWKDSWYWLYLDDAIWNKFARIASCIFLRSPMLLLVVADAFIFSHRHTRINIFNTIVRFTVSVTTIIYVAGTIFFTELWPMRRARTTSMLPADPSCLTAWFMQYIPFVKLNLVWLA